MKPEAKNVAGLAVCREIAIGIRARFSWLRKNSGRRSFEKGTASRGCGKTHLFFA
jgi:hypothetical protein